MALFDDFNWGDFLNSPAAAQIGTAVGGSIMSTVANNNAKRDYQAGQQANVAAINNGANSAIATNNATADTAADIAAPAIQTMKQNLSRDPNQLTPQQQISLDDSRRSAIRSISPGLRGSGRAVAAINDDLTNRTKANFVEKNRQTQQHNADALATNQGAAYAARGNVATLQANAGANTGKAMADTGAVNANADTATGSTAASTLGSIGSIIANGNKDQTRNSRYQQYKSQSENPNGGG